MKTTLLYVGATLFISSCVDTSNSNERQDLPVEEMKASVEAVEIHFEKEKNDSVIDSEPKLIIHNSPNDGRCTLPNDELGSDKLGSIPDRPVIISCPPMPLPDHEIFEIPEIDAQYPGGIVAMKEFIYSNLSYPDPYVDVQGTVYVSFVIEKDGSISRAKVARGIGEKYDQEALRVVNSMPNWIPANSNGKVVVSKVRMPIRFTFN